MSNFFDEIAAKLATLSGSATPKVSLEELNEFDVRDIQAVRVSEGGGGGGGGNVPFVGDDPPDSPTDGMLWWDPDDDTPVPGGLPAGAASVFAFTQTFTAADFAAVWDTPNAQGAVPLADLLAGDQLLSQRVTIISNGDIHVLANAVLAFADGEPGSGSWATPFSNATTTPGDTGAAAYITSATPSDSGAVMFAPATIYALVNGDADPPTTDTELIFTLMVARTP